jgi:hypothetical protein
MRTDRREVDVGRYLLRAVTVMLVLASPALAALRAATAKTTAATTVASLDGVRYRTTVVDGRTQLVQLAPTRRSVMTLREPLQLRLVEPGGRRVVLATPLPAGADPYRPGGRASTRLVVADTEERTSRTYTVSRNIEADAFGVGNGQLFVVDHRPALQPTYYRVAGLDLRSGDFYELFGPDKQPLTVNMTGTARAQVGSIDGRQLYTLYTQHAHAHDGAHSDAASAHAFVHVLDLTSGWAYCVDLPAEFGQGPARASSIAVDQTGTILEVVDRHAGRVARVPTAQLSLGTLTQRAPEVQVSSV